MPKAHRHGVEVVEALQALGGSARWKDLRGHVGWRAIRAARSDGRVIRERGAWAVARTDRPQIAALQMRGVRSHRTAAAHHGFALPPTDDDRHDVTVPHKARRAKIPADVRLHYRDYAPGHVLDDVTIPVITVVDCLRDLSLREALSVGDSALRCGKVTLVHMRQVASTLRGPGSRRVRKRIALLDAKAANAFESSARAILIDAGIPGFEPQVDIRHKGVWIGRVDLAHRALMIVIECDGFETHGTLEAMTKDVSRHTLLTSAGWRTLRFTWYQVMFQPEWVLERVHDTLETPKPPEAVVRERRHNAQSLAFKGLPATFRRR